MIETFPLTTEATTITASSEFVETPHVSAETPLMTPLDSVSKEGIKQAILSLIRENNAEFKQFFAELLTNNELSSLEKEQEKSLENAPVEAVKFEQPDWREMPFWKAHPELKPIEIKPNPNKKKLYEAMVAFATNPETRLTDDLMVHELD